MSDKLVEATILALQGKLKLNEANPSKLKKIKDKTKDIHYEPMEGDYEHVPFDYVLHGGDYEGYIEDKKGNKYTVVASHSEGDTGAIAGGTTYYYVDIAYGEHKIGLQDYTAIFSKNDGPGRRLITDLQDGMYLEDYLQKNIKAVHDISNIEDWKKEQYEAGNKLRGWEAERLWIEENIISNNEDYDERTKKQKSIDKKNENDFIELRNNVPVYLENNQIKLAKDLNLKGKKYTGNKDYSKFVSSDDIVSVRKGTPLLLGNDTLQKIIDMITTRGRYDFEITLEDLNNVTLELDELYSIFQVTNKGLKLVHKDFKDMETVKVYYRSSPNYIRCTKLDDLMQQSKINLNNNFTIPKLYKEIQARLGGAKESIVEIIFDYSKHEYRAQGDDGEHGKAWVQFPKDLRQSGKKYKVDQLIWNGKNYRAKGNIEEIQ